MSIQSVMPSNHLILCHPLLLLPSIFPSIRVFSNESTLHSSKMWSWSNDYNQDLDHLSCPHKAGPLEVTDLQLYLRMMDVSWPSTWSISVIFAHRPGLCLEGYTSPHPHPPPQFLLYLQLRDEAGESSL